MKKAIIGYGGHAMEVFYQMKTDVVFFVNDDFVVDGVLPLSKFNSKEYEVIIAISNPLIREKIKNNLPKDTKYFTFIHPTSLIIGDVEIGEGSFIGAYSVLTTNIKIGNHAILNRGNHIGHDSIIGDFFSAMPGAIVSGNVTIGNNVYIGTNSSIKEKINICDNVNIGLNSGVVKDITISGTYGGVPSKKIK